MAAGVYPIVNITSSALLPTANALYYNNNALDVLEKNTVFRGLMWPDSIPKKRGRRVQWYRPMNFSEPTTFTPSDGSAIGTQLSYNTRTIQCTLANYTDFLLLSRQMVDTSPVPDLEDATARLAYRLSLLDDNINRGAIDNEAPSMALAPLGTYLSTADAHNVRTQLANRNVTRGAGDHGKMFPCVFSPLSSYDVFHDPNVGGFTDVVKYNQDIKRTPLTEYATRGNTIAQARGCDFIESTNVKVITGSPNLYRSYWLGYQAFGTVALNNSNGRMDIHSQLVEKGPWDPAGELGALASFNFWTAATPLDGPAATIGGVYRGFTIDCQSAVG
jgi:N4-gp56 family major capsid protein